MRIAYLFYEAPNYEDFCGERALGVIDTEADCVAVGGKWNAYGGEIEPLVEKELERTGYCDVYYTCTQEYEAVSEVYYRNIFLIALPLGIVLVVVGILIFGLEVVGAGLAGGGVGVILWGVGGYWRYGSNLLKFSLSLLGLVAVIWLAYWFNKRMKK